MGMSVWYLIATLLLVLVNGEAKDNDTHSSTVEPGSSTPAPGHPHTTMKELVLYLTPEQAKVLEDAGAIVRPFPQFENAFLEQKLQQSVEEHSEVQNQPTSDNEDLKPDIEQLDEFYKVINIKKLNEDLAIQAQRAEDAAGETTEKPRPKYKYIPKGRQQEYAASYVQKKNNKTKSYSTEYVRYLPNFEVENFKIEPYQAEPLPGYYYQNTHSNAEPHNFLHNTQPDIRKHEKNEANEKVQKITIETQKMIEVQPQEEINYKYQDVQKPYNIQRFENVQTQKKSVEIQKLEEVQPQEEIYKPLGIQRLRNSQRLRYVKKSKRPLEIQKLKEVQRNKEVQRPVNNQRSNSPLAIQKHEEVQRYEDNQRPLEVQRPVYIQRHEEIQRLEDKKPFIETSTRTLVLQHLLDRQPIGSILPTDSSLNDKGPVTFEEKPQESDTIGQSDDAQTPLEIQTSLEGDANVKLGLLTEEQKETPYVSPTPSVSMSTSTFQDQFSSLLAPLVQHEKITETIAQQKYLVNSERAIQMKLQQLRESGSVDGTKFKVEIDKLNKNLVKQNALAQKLAMEAISKNQEPQISPKQNPAFKKRPSLELRNRFELPMPTSGLVHVPQPVEFNVPRPYPVPTPGLVHVPQPLELRVPRLYPVPFRIVRPIPVPVLLPENTDIQIPVPTEGEKLIRAPEIRNVYGDYIENNLPVNYPIHHSDDLAVIRHIWEH